MTGSGSDGDALRRRAQQTIAKNALALSELGRGGPLTARGDGASPPAQEAPRRRIDVADVAGKAWNAPNTALGLGLGAVGYGLGQLNRLRPGDQPDPRVQMGHNAVEFIHNPLMRGAITLGNTTNYQGDPYDPKDKVWYPQGEDPRIAENGHSYPEHEEQHTYQGQQLGPLYLPSNIVGGATGLIFDRNWHGDHNWNERGPQETAPRAWSVRPTR